MSCIFGDLSQCASGLVGPPASQAAVQAWDVITRSFADATAALFRQFGTAFVQIPDLNLRTAGLETPYGIAAITGSTVAALLVLIQVMRTLWTRDGSGIAQAVTGIAKTVLAWLLTSSVATAALAASDEVSRFIVRVSFGSTQALAARLGSVVNGLHDSDLQGLGSSALLLVLSLLGTILVLVLWFELLLRNAALAVLIAVSPVSAAGQVSDMTRIWWSRAVAAGVQLIILKPVIAFVFAVGFAMASHSTGTPAIIQGLLVLALAAFAWPIVARFFTFSTVQAANGGLSVALGFAAGVALCRGWRWVAG